jgi:putative phage-type endonuclease
MLQRSPEWYAARLGRVGASRIGDLMAQTRSGYGASRGNLMAELIVERLTGTPYNGYTNAAMQWGIDNEAGAKEAYAFVTDVEIEEVGFLDHPRIAMAGASPDGLIGTEGLCEVKCPNSATHIETLLTGTIDVKYRLQMQFQLAVTGREWCDFCSYDPRMPPAMQLWIRRVGRDDKTIADIEREVREFLSELAAKVDRLRQRYEIA